MLTKRKIIFVLIALCCLVYMNALRGEFVSDDINTIVESPRIENPRLFLLEPSQLFDSFCFLAARLKVFPYHFVSLILHCTVTILVFYFLRLFFALEPSFVGASLFAVHPVHAEAVSWISGKPYLFLALFTLSCYLLYYRTAQSLYADNIFRRKRYLIALLLFTYNIMQNYSFFAFLPFFIAFSDIVFGQWRKTWKLWLPFFLILAFSLFFGSEIIYKRIQDAPQVTGTLAIENPFRDLLYSFFGHLGLLIWPGNLTFYHEPIEYLPWPLAIVTVFACVLLWLLPRLHKKAPIIFFGLGLFTIFLAPTYFPIPIASLIAERYLYVPSIFLCVVLAFFYERYSHTRQGSYRKWFIILIGLGLMAYALRAVDRNADWKTQERLWRATLLFSPESARAHNNMGLVYVKEENYKRAANEFTIAAQISESFIDPQNNLGVLQTETGEVDNALPYFQKALELDSSRPENYFNIGVVYHRIWNVQAAINAYNKSLQLDPRFEKSYNNLGTLYVSLGQFETAEKNFLKTVEINPRFVDAYYNLGNLYSKLGRHQEAIPMFKKVIEKSPGHVAAYSNLGVVSSLLGETTEAIFYFKQAMKFDPAFVQAYNNLGDIYHKMGKAAQAIEMLQKAIEIQPDYGTAHYNLARIYFEAGKYDLAAYHCDKAGASGYKVPPEFLKELKPYRKE